MLAGSLEHLYSIIIQLIAAGEVFAIIHSLVLSNQCAAVLPVILPQNLGFKIVSAVAADLMGLKMNNHRKS